jgi:hypothetical protein
MVVTATCCHTKTSSKQQHNDVQGTPFHHCHCNLKRAYKASLMQ